MAVLFRLSRNGEDKLILFVGLVRNPPCSKARQLFASALQIVWHEFCRRLLTEFSLSLSLSPPIPLPYPRRGYFSIGLSCFNLFLSSRHNRTRFHRQKFHSFVFPRCRDGNSFVVVFVKEIKGFDPERYNR